MHETHPVYLSLKHRLDALRDQYQRDPNDQSRYQLVRLEQLLAQWAPDAVLIS
jgi:hypothetical protein